MRRKLVREHLGLLKPDNVSSINANSHPLPVKNDYDWGSHEDLLVEDPLSPAFWKLLTSTAETNTEIFRNIFHAVPDDASSCLYGSLLMPVRTTAEYDAFVTQTPYGHVADYSMPLEYIVRLLSNVRGHIVNMPLHYLEDVQLIHPGFNPSVNEFTGLSLRN